MNFFSTNNPIISCYNLLAMHAFLTCVLITNRSLIFIKLNVSSLDIVIHKSDINVCILQVVIYVSQHVQFNSDEFPYNSLFSSNSAPRSCSSSFPTSYFESMSLFNPSGVAQPGISSLSSSPSSQSMRSLSNRVLNSPTAAQPVVSVPHSSSHPIVSNWSRYTALLQPEFIPCIPGPRPNNFN